MGEDTDLWRAFIARDIPNWASKNWIPKNPLKWYEVYCKYKKWQRKEIERDEEILRNTMLGIKKEQATKVSRVVDLRTLPKVPRDPRMLANNGGVPLGKRAGPAKLPPNSLTFNGGSKTKMKDGKSVLTRARREAREISARSKLATPTSQLVGNKRQIVKAPAGMVNEYRKAADPGLRILSRKKSTVGQFNGGVSGPSLEEREKRLRAAMGGGSSRGNASGSAPGTETFVGTSDEDSLDEEDEEGDDLFDDEPKRPSQAARPAQSYAARPSSRPLPGPSTSRPPPEDMGRPRPDPFSSPPTLGAYDTSKPSSSRPQLASSPPPRSNTSSPAPGMKPMMPRKRPPVDVFNRGAKKPRVAR
jgi:elongin-A